ncbi:MAG: heavy metal translocating P-type ATPase [Candidatus Bipolaricaulaceae bacterium]
MYQTTTVSPGRVHCRACAVWLERRLTAMTGVEQAQVDRLSGEVWVRYDVQRLRPEEVKGAVASVAGQIVHIGEQGRKPQTLLLVASGALLVAGGTVFLVGSPAWGAISLAEVAWGLGAVVGGIPAARQGLAQLSRRLLGIDLLVTIAILGALALGEWFEAASLAFLFGLAERLEEGATGRARRSLRQLLDRAPRQATVVRGDRELELPVEAVSPGEVILARPGETIALDGEVVRGEASVSEAAVTGEATPVFKVVGAPVYAGSLNEDGALEIRVDRPAGDSTLARMARLVEEAQRNKAPLQRLVDRFASRYTPAVVGMAVLVAAVPVILGQPHQPWLLRALTLLVIACPCALAIATPVAMTSALAAGARRGILINGGAVLEKAAKATQLALDKTGTLTTGELQAEVIPVDGQSAGRVLRVAAALERGSEHPLARAVQRLAADVSLPPVEGFRNLPGQGVKGKIEGRTYLVGRAELFGPLPAELHDLVEQGRPAVLVGEPGRPLGAIQFSEQVRPQAEAALTAAGRLGLRPVILTGDHAQAAQAVAQKLGIKEVHAELLPAGKLSLIGKLKARGPVMFVGDGMNDAPALAAADVGVAMAAVGTDAALEAADAALLGDDLAAIGELVRLSRRAVAVVRGNIALAMALKLSVIGLALAGHASLAVAVLVGDVGATLLVTGNALRLQRTFSPTPGHRRGRRHRPAPQPAR